MLVCSIDTEKDEELFEDSLIVPDYLEKHYWWAYVRPWAVRVFEREWLVNLILWGFYRPLRDRTLAAMGEALSGRTLKISCCYGQLEPRLAARVKAGGGMLDIIDIAPEQLKNARRKLARFIEDGTVCLHRRDATALGFADASYDRALLFFLPHEQPEDVRRLTFYEALRVLKPGGALYVVEFAKPKAWHPLKYIWHPVLRVLEPFASALWTREIASFLPCGGAGCQIETQKIFGGFYQITRIEKETP